MIIYNHKEQTNRISKREDKDMTKAYIVKQDTFDFYYGQYQGTNILGYFFNKADAEKIAKENLANNYKTVEDAYIEEIEIQ